MKRIADRAWTWVLCLVVCVGAVCFLIGRLSAGQSVRVQTEKRVEDSAALSAGASDAGNAAGAQQECGSELPLDGAENLSVNLNTATKEELMTLPRIGEKLAERILAYREENGRFIATEQLMDIDGIGEAIYAAIREQVTVEEEP